MYHEIVQNAPILILDISLSLNTIQNMNYIHFISLFMLNVQFRLKPKTFKNIKLKDATQKLHELNAIVGW